MNISCSLDYPVVSQGEEQSLHLLVCIDTPAHGTAQPRKPVAIAVVVDRSDSMAGPKLEGVREAVTALVDQLGPQDRLCVVTYNHVVEVPVPPAPVADRESIKALVYGIVAEGATNLSGGWLRGLSLLRERTGEDFVRRALLLSDGLANRGVTGATELAEIARQHKAMGLSTTTMGFGTDFDEELLGAIAREGGGLFHYIRSPRDDAPAAFLEEFGQLARILGQNLEVGIETSEHVCDLDVMGELRKEKDGDLAKAFLGDVVEQDRKSLLARVTLKKHLPVGEVEIAKVHAAYDAVRGELGRRQHTSPVKVEVSAETAADVKPDPEVVLHIILYQIASMRKEAVLRLEAGSVEGAIDSLRRALRWAVSNRALSPDRMSQESRALRGLLQRLERARRQAPLRGTGKEAHNLLRDATLSVKSYVMGPSAILDRLRSVSRAPGVRHTIVLSPGGVGKVGVVRASGALDERAARELAVQIGGAVGKGDICGVILDLAQCLSVSSGALPGLRDHRARPRPSAPSFPVHGFQCSRKGESEHRRR